MPSSDDAAGPSLGFEWELAVFRGVRRLARAVTGGRRPSFDPARAAVLPPLERRLSILAQIVAGESLRVRVAAGAGGVVGSTLYLPGFVDIAPTPGENERLYVVRTVLAASLYRLGPPRAPLPDDPLARAELEVARAEAAVASAVVELPAFAATYAAACRLVLSARAGLRGLRGVEAERERVRRGALARGAGAPVAEVPEVVEVPARLFRRRPTTPSPPVVLWGELRCEDPLVDERPQKGEIRPPERGAAQREAAPIEQITQVVLDEKELEDAVLIHSFEKIDTADEHQGGARNLDGSDELADHAEALEEVRLGKVVRSADPVHAVLRADVGLTADIPDVDSIAPGERGIPYDEWDHARRSYREGFCTVYPTPVVRTDPAWAREVLGRNRALVRRLTRDLEARRSRLAPQRAQRDGDAIDLDAFVRHLAAAEAFEAGAPRLYVRRARERRDVATTVLLDLSLSSDAWVDNRRVLDLTRESALLLGEVAEALGDPLELLGFASHTRNRCRVWEIRGWDTPWAVGRARLGPLSPRGYTRIGPALRHAALGLSRRPAKDRLLFLLTDGKPTDYDRYEGRHGIADVRQAVREADRLGVRVHALTVDRTARDDLPAMLGPGRFHLIRSAADLPAALVAAYAALAG